MLEAGKGSVDSLKVIEETICDREKTIAATQDRVKMLEGVRKGRGWQWLLLQVC